MCNNVKVKIKELLVLGEVVKECDGLWTPWSFLRSNPCERTLNCLYRKTSESLQERSKVSNIALLHITVVQEYHLNHIHIHLFLDNSPIPWSIFWKLGSTGHVYVDFVQSVGWRWEIAVELVHLIQEVVEWGSVSLVDVKAAGGVATADGHLNSILYTNLQHLQFIYTGDDFLGHLICQNKGVTDTSCIIKDVLNNVLANSFKTPGFFSHPFS